MARTYPYQITLRLYSGRQERHYIHALNRHDAFDKAHRFANPIALSGYDGVQFIDVVRLTKQYCGEHGIHFDC